MIKRIGILIFFVAVAISVLFLLRGKVQKAETSPATGRQLYTSYCTPCHGDKGKGDGELSYVLYPKPRDFTKGMFKLRSTPSGQVPTDEDLLKTVRNGMPGTAMPSFYFLQEDQMKKLVDYVKEISQECKEEGAPCKNYFQEQKPQPVQIPVPLPPSEEIIAKGKELYAQFGCGKCHGDSGKGDGIAAAGLKDAWGYPIKVRDFTQGTYLGGGRPQDLYLRFATGLNGTPMPSYGEIIDYLGKTEQERQQLIWGLVHYVKSLETPEARAQKSEPPKDGIIHAVKVNDDKNETDLLNPVDADWEKMHASAIPLSRLWQKDGNNASVVQVRALYNNDYVAVMMEWNDITKDAGSFRVQDFQDAAAVQFSLTGAPGFHGMGSAATPADIWFWRAEWQIRKDNNRKPDVKQAYIQRASDAATISYPKEIEEDAVLPGRDVGNIVSGERINSPVEEVNAQGPGTLAPQSEKEQNILGKGIWDGKTWRVVFVRKLETDDENDVQFDREESFPVALAVWNGAEKDRNGQKLVSTWYTLKFQQ